MTTLQITVFGLSLTSSWGNGHATTYRSLLKALSARGHVITFFERDAPWYADSRDLPDPYFCHTVLYRSLDELSDHASRVARSDLVILGSYVPQGPELARWIARQGPRCFAFYDIDTPVTLAALAEDRCEYLERSAIPAFDLYLSFSGGPVLRALQRYGARRPRPLYCAVDVELYAPTVPGEPVSQYELSYLGTYSEDRQPRLRELLLEPAKARPEAAFAVAGAQYPKDVSWPANVQHIAHLPPDLHRSFYNRSRFALNVTRQRMVEAGYSPSVRMFEAAACGTPIISDPWEGLGSFFDVGTEVLVARDRDDVLETLKLDESEREELADNLRRKVLARHTAQERALELESYVREVLRSSADNGEKIAS